MDNSSIAVIGSFAYQALNFFNLVFTTIAAIIFVYLFFFEGKAISSIYKLLLNHFFQISQYEIYDKIKEVNGYNANENQQKVREILCDIKGQMRGNPILAKNCKLILKKLSKFEQHPEELNNNIKFELMSELKEKIRYINIQSYDELLGEKKI